MKTINVDYDWWTFAYDNAENMGIKITGFGLDRRRHATGEFIYDALHTAHKIMSKHGEQCETYKTAQAFINERDNIVNNAERDENGDFVDEYELDSQLDEVEEQFLADILEDYSIILQNEYEYLTSNE